MGLILVNNLITLFLASTRSSDKESIYLDALMNIQEVKGDGLPFFSPVSCR